MLLFVDFPLNSVQVSYELCVLREALLIYLYILVPGKPRLHGILYIYRKQTYGLAAVEYRSYLYISTLCL